MPKLLQRIVLGLWCCLSFASQAQPLGQVVTVSSQFQDLIMPASLWVEVRDPNAGSVRPFYLRLNQRAQSEAFATYSNDFVISRIWLEFDDGHVMKPCRYDRNHMINKQSVEIHLTGLLDHTFAVPQCHVKFYNTPPIQQLMPVEDTGGQQLETEQAISNDQANYFAALKNCQPSAYRYKSYQPFIDEALDTLAIIEGEEGNNCNVLKETKFKSAQGTDATAITRCQFSKRTRAQLTSKNIKIILDASQDVNAAKNTLYTKAVCDECSALANGKSLRCFEKFSEEKSDEVRATS